MASVMAGVGSVPVVTVWSLAVTLSCVEWVVRPPWLVWPCVWLMAGEPHVPAPVVPLVLDRGGEVTPGSESSKDVITDGSSETSTSSVVMTLMFRSSEDTPLTGTADVVPIALAEGSPADCVSAVVGSWMEDQDVPLVSAGRESTLEAFPGPGDTLVGCPARKDKSTSVGSRNLAMATGHVTWDGVIV